MNGVVLYFGGGGGLKIVETPFHIIEGGTYEFFQSKISLTVSYLSEREKT